MEEHNLELPDDFAPLWIQDDFKRLRTICTLDEMRDACVDLMISREITAEQMDSGLAILRERLREMHS